MAIHALPTNFDATVANEAGRHATPVPPQPGQETDELYWGDDGFTFGDVLDVVNPLQHLPVVGTAYREITGDTISPAAKIIGGMIFGGPIGMVLAIVNAIFEEATGKEFGTAVADLVTGEDTPTQLADAETAPAAAQDVTAAKPEPKTVALATPPAAPPATATAPATLPNLAPAPGVPQLSPQAFDALVRSFNGPISRKTAPSAPVPAPRPGVAAGAEAPAATTGALPSLVPVGKPIPLLRPSAAAEPVYEDRRQAALDLHQQLRAYAEEKGITVAAVPPRR